MHVAAGLQQYAFLGLQLRAVLLAVGGGAIAIVGFAGDEQELPVPVLTVLFEGVQGIGIQREFLAGLDLDALRLAIDGAQGQVVSGAQAERAAPGVQRGRFVRVAAHVQGTGRLDVDAVIGPEGARAHLHTCPLGSAHHANAAGAHGAEQAGVDA
ncbi:hypothetical protein D3C71_1574980 [compost metagenome]